MSSSCGLLHVWAHIAYLGLPAFTSKMPCATTYVTLVPFSFSFPFGSITSIAFSFLVILGFSLGVIFALLFSFWLSFSITLVFWLALATALAFSLSFNPVNFHWNWPIHCARRVCTKHHLFWPLGCWSIILKDHFTYPRVCRCLCDLQLKPSLELTCDTPHQDCCLQIIIQTASQLLILWVCMLQFQDMLHQRKFARKRRPIHDHVQQAYTPVFANRFILLDQSSVGLQSVASRHLSHHKQGTWPQQGTEQAVEERVALLLHVIEIHRICWTLWMFPELLNVLSKLGIHRRNVLLEGPAPLLPCCNFPFTGTVIKGRRLRKQFPPWFSILCSRSVDCWRCSLRAAAAAASAAATIRVASANPSAVATGDPPAEPAGLASLVLSMENFHSTSPANHLMINAEKGKHCRDQKFLDLPLPKWICQLKMFHTLLPEKQPGGGTPVLDLQSPVFVQLPVFCRLYMKSPNPAVLKSKLQRFTKTSMQSRYSALPPCKGWTGTHSPFSAKGAPHE